MMRSAWIVALVSLVAMLTAPLSPAFADPPPQRSCAVSSGRAPETARPDEVALDPVRLRQAMDFALGRNRVDIQIFRHNCLVATSPLHATTGTTAWNMWSITKSVVSLVVGIAVADGKLGLDDPIGRYLPPGLGDAAHRAITIRDLLTETSGLRLALLTEGATGLASLDPNSAVQALAMPLDTPPGAKFAYGQRAVDLLAYVTGLAAGEDIQQYAQQKLFEPLGIRPSDYFWARDRSGHSYGYAYLLMPPDDIAELGLLTAANGRWHDRQIVPADYLRQALAPSPRNPCYGFLFWRAAPGCDVPLSGFPPGSYAMWGLGQQNVFVVPSLDLVIVWTGLFGDVSKQGIGGSLFNVAEISHDFARLLWPAVRDATIPDPGPYVERPLVTDPNAYAKPDILLAPFGIGPLAYPGCDQTRCLGQPLAPPFAGWPPGCVIQVCVGNDPRTPGIR